LRFSDRLRDESTTNRTFAPRACRAAVLCAATLFALHAYASVALAQDRAADEQQDKVLKETGIRRPPVVNTMPWTDLAQRGKELFDQGRLGPDTRLDVTARGERADDGTLKPETVVLKWTAATDETTASLAQQFFTALSQSKALGALEGAKDVSVRLRLDETNASFSITAGMPSDERAKQLSEGYGMLVRLATTQKKGTLEGELYEAVRFASDGRLFTFAFEMPKERLCGIVTEMLAKKAARAQSNQ
jgi:hypothetical protein